MDGKISLKDAIFIGKGGMVGGGIFAVLGLAVSLSKGRTPIAFLFAGIIALLTSLIQQYQDNKLGVAVAVGIMITCFIIEISYKKTLPNNL